MRGRAEAMPVCVDGKLDVTLPTVADENWARDGLPERWPSGIDGWPRLQIRPLIRVPPSHWERHFGMAPEALIAATAEATARSQRRMQLLEAWTHAAARFGERHWATPLWAFWRAATAEEVHLVSDSPNEQVRLLIPLLTSAERETWTLAALTEQDAEDPPSLRRALEALPIPWSEAVGMAYIQGLRADAATLPPQSENVEPWDDTIPDAALALPPSCFAAALEPIATPESGNWYVSQFRHGLDSFAKTIRVRQRIQEEIPL
jgi:hypothetical protein